ncbi:hypothetical protein N7454_004654 [Penicillium verhagenii]|nr:hypothetical protein N7454_004654 [Penicillium verhagenii]
MSDRSSNFEIMDLVVDPITLLTVHTLDQPRSLDHLLRQIPDDLLSALIENPEVPKGVRSTILHREHEVLYKITPYHYHEKIKRQFEGRLNDDLRELGLRSFNLDIWLGGAGRSNGRVSSKEADGSFFPGRFPAAGAPVPWPSLVLEVGLPESIHQLRTDVRWWYNNSDHQTQVVVLISAYLNSHDADIEIWTPVVDDAVGMATRCQETISWLVQSRPELGMERYLVMHWK